MARVSGGWWVGIGLGGAMALGVGCKDIFGINELHECPAGDLVGCYDGPPETKDVGACRAGTQVCDANGVPVGSCEGAVLPQQEDCNTAEDEACNGNAPEDCGVLLSAYRAGDEQDQRGTALAIDSNEAVFVAGEFKGDLVLPCESLAPTSVTNSVVWAKFQSDLEGCNWKEAFSIGSNEEVPQSMTTDSKGRVALGGSYSSSIELCPIANQTGADNAPRLIQLTGATSGCLWIRQLSAESTAGGIAVDADANDQLIVTASTSGSIQLPGCGEISGQSSLLVTKLDPDVPAPDAGQCVWARTFSDASSMRASDVAVDPDGDVIIAARFSGALAPMDCQKTYPPSTPHGAENLLLMKLNGTDGSCVWARSFSNASGGEEATERLAVIPPDGRVVLAGRLAGDVDFNEDGTFELSSPGGEAFVAAFSADGSNLWSLPLLSGDAQVDVAVDKSTSNIVLAGAFTAPMQLGPPADISAENAPDKNADFLLESMGGKDIFIAKIDPMGKPIWARSVGNDLDQAATAVAVGARGDIFLTGYFQGQIDLGSGNEIQSAGGNDLFIAKLSP